MNDRPDDPRLGLDAFDAIDPPDQWDEIVQRASVPSIAPRDRRPWWPVAAAAAALIVIAGSILTLRDDEAEAPAPATVPTLPAPATVDDAAPAPTTDVPAPTVPPVTVAPVTTPPPTTAPPTTVPTITLAPTTTTTVPAVSGASLWDTECVEVAGAAEIETADPAAFASFIGLGAQPVLEVVLSGFDDASAADVRADAVPIPGGVLVSMSGHGEFDDEDGDVPDDVVSTVIAAIDVDGSLRWRRCLEAEARLHVAPVAADPRVAWLQLDALTTDESVVGIDLGTGETVETSIDLALGRPTGSGRWRVIETEGPDDVRTADDRLVIVDLLDGSVEEVPYPADMLGMEWWLIDTVVVDGDAPIVGLASDDRSVTRAYVDGAWTGDPGVLADVLPATVIELPDGGIASIDGAGRTMWSDPDWRSGMGEVFRWFATDDVVVSLNCVTRDSADRCAALEDGWPETEFVAYDARTGAVLWRSDEGGGVSQGEGSVGLVRSDPDGDGIFDGYRLIDLRTGERLVSAEVSEWPDQFFGTECCGGDQFNRTDRFGGVIIQKTDDRFFLWYPPALTTPTATASLLG